MEARHRKRSKKNTRLSTQNACSSGFTGCVRQYHVEQKDVVLDPEIDHVLTLF
jgi:hypothetical protein